MSFYQLPAAFAFCVVVVGITGGVEEMMVSGSVVMSDGGLRSVVTSTRGLTVTDREHTI